MRPSIVCFDLGGVVVRICRSFAEACERAGLPQRDPHWMKSDEALARRRTVIDDYQRGAISTESYFLAMVDATAGRYTVEEVRRVHDAWLVEEYRGVCELIEKLNATPGVITACLSNTNERHWSVLAEGARSVYPSVKNLAHRFASHLIRSSKPDAAIYRHAERGLAVEGGEILFFDDLPANVQAARARGWRAEVVDPEGAPAQQLDRYLKAHGVFS